MQFQIVVEIACSNFMQVLQLSLEIGDKNRQKSCAWNSMKKIEKKWGKNKGEQKDSIEQERGSKEREKDWNKNLEGAASKQQLV